MNYFNFQAWTLRYTFNLDTFSLICKKIEFKTALKSQNKHKICEQIDCYLFRRFVYL